MTKNTITRELEWAELLKSAVNDEGVLSNAYRAFHNYSIGNQMLAITQCWDRDIAVGPINTFKGWQTLGRQVQKGSKAIQLCMPVTSKYTKEDSKTGEETEHTFQHFIYRKNWFVMAQTEGDEQPAPKMPGFDVKKALKTLGIVEVDFERPKGNMQGYAYAENIAVSPVAEYPHKTRFHEIAHVVLGHTVEHKHEDSPDTPKNIKEVEAESVSYVLCQILGLTGGAESRGYIQHWLTTATIPEKSAQKIFGAANKILKAGEVDGGAA